MESHPCVFHRAALNVPSIETRSACLRVRDLLFARKERKKQIPHPVRKPNGVRNDMFFGFSATCEAVLSR